MSLSSECYRFLRKTLLESTLTCFGLPATYIYKLRPSLSLAIRIPDLLPIHIILLIPLPLERSPIVLSGCALLQDRQSSEESVALCLVKTRGEGKKEEALQWHRHVPPYFMYVHYWLSLLRSWCVSLLTWGPEFESQVREPCCRYNPWGCQEMINANLRMAENTAEINFTTVNAMAYRA